MKIKSLAFLTGFLVVATSTALAGDNSDQKDAKPSNSVAKNKKAEKQIGASETYKGVKVTGSNIKQDIRKHGMITDSQSQLLVIDQQTIEKSGAVDLRQLLSKTGIR